MSDTSPKDQRELQHGAPTKVPRQPQPGEEVWRVRLPNGDVHRCELRDHSRQGAGWDFQIFNGAELLVSRRCENEQHARRVAEMAKGDYLRQDCVAIEKGA